eukprot:g31034.t1
MWSTASAAPDVAASTLVRSSGGSEATLNMRLRSVLDKRQHLPVANHFNSPSHSLGNMSILGILQCHNDATQKLEEQHLIFCL